ncbi:DHH family protein [Elsinoe ampelina]|uniref:DHH family protein n=1 Tax=Elsinoe ampelina TaxID=302913 RepID=A0A6A6GH04_9PEZI|nr:DHH family protein [Elsinoe ampelina]
MKRKEAPTKDKSPSKKKRPEVPEYHLTPTNKDASGQDIWPAPADQIDHARRIIQECAAAGKPTIICPDKDADGLSSGVILHRTLVTLGLSPDLISVHLLEKSTTVHSEHERARLTSLSPSYLFVLDHGSRSSPPLVPLPCTTLIIDHHHSTPSDFPSDSTHVTACHSPPVATTSLLTYHITLPLSPLLSPLTSWLCIIGTHGDLGTTLKWLPPFPDMSGPLKLYTKKALNEAVSLLNAPRRTATYDVLSAWTALLTATHPKDISTSPRLAAARAEVNAEVERATHAAPKFSADGKVAVFRIRSACQVHPVIATRWAGHLNSRALEIVMVANEGYLEGKVNFSCRVARCARGRGEEVDIIRALRGYASLGEGGEGKGPLLERLGDDFARGHVQASGGIVKVEEFEELMGLMRVGEKSEAQKKREEDKANGVSPVKGKVIDKGQTNTLMGYFGKKGGK